MRKISLYLLFVFVFFLVPTTSLQAVFRLDHTEKTTNFYDGVRHTRMIASIEYDGTTTNQKINYLGANPTSYSDLNVVVGDNYLTHGWGKGDLETIINNVNERYDNYTVIGGVNGDFFGANGIPIEAYIRDFEVLSDGLNVNRTVIGFKDNGEVLFGRPCFEGMEAIVFNDEYQIKHRFPIEYINKYPSSSSTVSVFFEDYSAPLQDQYTKVVIGATETKLDEYFRTYFGKGLFHSERTDSFEVAPQTFALVGLTLNSDNLITEGDTVIVQQKTACGWEDVRFALGGWETLVKDGVSTEEHTEGAGPSYRHPRTAIGVKEDGTVFFVTVDGRDYNNGYLGVTAYEMAEIMQYFGAVDAYNLDGGGSTTMMVKDDTEQYVYLNTPSDGQPRPVTNGVFFVTGEHKNRPVVLPYPDTRDILNHPENLFISNDGVLTFDAITNASSYDVLVNEEVYTTLTPSLELNLQPGIHFIQAKANGDYTDYKDSPFSPQIIYIVYNKPLDEIIALLQSITKHQIN